MEPTWKKKKNRINKVSLEGNTRKCHHWQTPGKGIKTVGTQGKKILHHLHIYSFCILNQGAKLVIQKLKGWNLSNDFYTFSEQIRKALCLHLVSFGLNCSYSGSFKQNIHRNTAHSWDYNVMSQFKVWNTKQHTLQKNYFTPSHCFSNLQYALSPSPLPSALDFVSYFPEYKIEAIKRSSSSYHQVSRLPESVHIHSAFYF